MESNNTVNVEERIKVKDIPSKSENDFYWDEEKEPHFQRRKEIMAKYPEVRKLFGINPNLKYITVAMVLVQMTIGIFAAKMHWAVFILVTYFIGATIAQALFLAIHEITHDLSSHNKVFNNWLAFFANIPIVLPFAMSFKFYHGQHHWRQGEDVTDTDIPSKFEAKVFRGFLGKLIWYVNQIVFYAVRPSFTLPMKMDKWYWMNFVFQFSVIGAYIYFAGWAALGYLVISIFVAGSLHPTAGHFISEHYVFEPGQETYSYYGPLNAVTFNVGYHNEHHDFPTIPGSRLDKLKKLAPEYYDNLKSYDSWVGVAIKFLFDKNVTLYSRTKRKKPTGK